MGANSNIEWTTHTFNPWIGCTKVSDGCKHCYAEELMDKRYHKVEWGPEGVRIKTAANWRQPLLWNNSRWICSECGKAHRDDTVDGKRCVAKIKIGVGANGPVYRLCGGALEWIERPRVFCSSLADVFEVKKDQQEDMDAWRLQLFDLIRQTPNLDWLFLTKRPQSIRYCIGRASMLCPDIPKNRIQDFVSNGPSNDQEALFAWVSGWHQGSAPANVWLGTSVEGDISRSGGNPIERIGVLADVPARVRFLSVEPLIAPLGEPDLTGIHWVIVGGESGVEARPMHPDWAREVRDTCQAQGVAFFFKQWGEHEWIMDAIGYLDMILNYGAAETASELRRYASGAVFVYPDGRRVGAPATFKACEAMIDNDENDELDNVAVMNRVGKKVAGRELDGRTWEEYPSHAMARASDCKSGRGGDTSRQEDEKLSTWTFSRPKIYSRRKGADPIPLDAVYVGRGTPHGNPHEMTREAERDAVCDAFEAEATLKASADPTWLEPLRGKDLVCWCQSPSDKKPKRCHAETLLRLANKQEEEDKGHV